MEKELTKAEIAAQKHAERRERIDAARKAGETTAKAAEKRAKERAKAKAEKATENENENE